MERLSRVTVKITFKELLYFSSLGAVTVYSKLRQFGYLVFATVAKVHCLQTVHLLHMQQPHHRLLTVVFVTRVTSSRNKAYCIGLQETFTQVLIARRFESYRLEKNIQILYLHEFSPKNSARLP